MLDFQKISHKTQYINAYNIFLRFLNTNSLFCNHSYHNITDTCAWVCADDILVFFLLSLLYAFMHLCAYFCNIAYSSYHCVFSISKYGKSIIIKTDQQMYPNPSTLASRPSWLVLLLVVILSSIQLTCSSLATGPSPAYSEHSTDQSSSRYPFQMRHYLWEIRHYLSWSWQQVETWQSPTVQNQVPLVPYACWLLFGKGCRLRLSGAADCEQIAYAMGFAAFSAFLPTHHKESLLMNLCCFWGMLAVSLFVA